MRWSRTVSNRFGRDNLASSRLFSALKLCLQKNPCSRKKKSPPPSKKRPPPNDEQKKAPPDDECLDGAVFILRARFKIKDPHSLSRLGRENAGLSSLLVHTYLIVSAFLCISECGGREDGVGDSPGHVFLKVFEFSSAFVNFGKLVKLHDASIFHD